MQGFFTTILAAEFPDRLAPQAIVEHIKSACSVYGIEVSLKDPDRETLAPPATGPIERYFLTLTGHDKPGVVRQISARLAQDGIDITDMYARRQADEHQPGVIERGLLLKMRFELDLYINLRPFTYPENGIDMIVIRENTEGSYAGEGGALRKGTPHEVATQGSVNTRMGVERAVRFAFDLAESRPRKHLTLVHKTNVLTHAGGLWMRTFEEVGATEFPGVERDYVHVDAACLYLVTSPERFDVVVTENLFGDIITDLGAAVQGGMGLAASANLDPTRTAPSMFEPVHGSAPDIVGTGKADPIAAVMSLGQMLAFLGEPDAGARVERAVAAELAERGGARPDGMGYSTREAGDRLAELVAT